MRLELWASQADRREGWTGGGGWGGSREGPPRVGCGSGKMACSRWCSRCARGAASMPRGAICIFWGSGYDTLIQNLPAGRPTHRSPITITGESGKAPIILPVTTLATERFCADANYSLISSVWRADAGAHCRIAACLRRADCRAASPGRPAPSCSAYGRRVQYCGGRGAEAALL